MMRGPVHYHADDLDIPPLWYHLLSAAGGMLGILIVGVVFWLITLLAAVMGWQ